MQLSSAIRIDGKIYVHRGWMGLDEDQNRKSFLKDMVEIGVYTAQDIEINPDYGVYCMYSKNWDFKANESPGYQDVWVIVDNVPQGAYEVGILLRLLQIKKRLVLNT